MAKDDYDDDDDRNKLRKQRRHDDKNNANNNDKRVSNVVGKGRYEDSEEQRLELAQLQRTVNAGGEDSLAQRHLWGNQVAEGRARLQRIRRDDDQEQQQADDDNNNNNPRQRQDRRHDASNNNNKRSRGGSSKSSPNDGGVDYRGLALDRRRRNTRHVRQLHRRLDHHSTKRLRAAVAVADSHAILQTTAPGLLEPEHDLEYTDRLTQEQLVRSLQDEEDTTRHRFDLTLTDHAPYGFRYDRSGRHGLLFGKRGGHLAILDNHSQSLVTEFHVHERIRDACFCHNHTILAAAQQQYVYLYDHRNGAQIHKCAQHHAVSHLQYLPYHWLLVSLSGRSRYLKYQDTSTGEMQAELHTQTVGLCMTQNPVNAVIHVGHAGGSVSLWSPASSKYLAKLQCHKNGVTAVAIDPTGHTMVTGCTTGELKVWDLRTYKERNAYHNLRVQGTPSSMDISQRGLWAIGHGQQVSIFPAEAWQQRNVPDNNNTTTTTTMNDDDDDDSNDGDDDNVDQQLQQPRGGATTYGRRPFVARYMRHVIPRSMMVETVRFRPFEDVCGIGHGRGMSSILVPGSGEPHLDTTEPHLNPTMDLKQRRDAEVRMLLDKLQPNMIALDAHVVGSIEPQEQKSKHYRLEQEQDAAENANAVAPVVRKKKAKQSQRGRSKIQVQLRRQDREYNKERREKVKRAVANKNDESDSDDSDDNESVVDKETRPNYNKKKTALSRGDDDSDADVPAALQRFL